VGFVLYYNISGGVMTGPYGFAWSPYEAAALNLIAGHRPVCGNYNAPCNLGVFLNDLPQNNHVRFVDDAGRALRAADVRVYQATAGPGWYGKTFDDTPDLFFSTDAAGYAHMPRNPFSSESIEHYYGLSNAVVVLRIEHASGLWYHFMEVSEFNMQYWAGNTQNGYHTVMLADAVGCVASDADSDGDVDLADFLDFQACFNGPNHPPVCE
jgi:hypothetical protein